MTVREWFRVQRVTQWERDKQTRLTDHWTQAGLSTLCDQIIRQQPFDYLVTLGTCKIIFRREEWERENRVIEAVRAQLQQAMAELERESARRAAVARWGDL